MITTIDSFCLFVVRNHFEEISLDPNFRIADEGEIRLLEQDVLEQVFEDNYARQEKTFLSLIDAYAGKRNDHGVREMVAKILPDTKTVLCKFLQPCMYQQWEF